MKKITLLFVLSVGICWVTVHTLSMSKNHDYCPEELRLWKGETSYGYKKFRLDRTVDKIKQLNADFLCLQECLPHMFIDLCDKLSEEYIGFHMKDFQVSSVDDLTKKTNNDSCLVMNCQKHSKLSTAKEDNGKTIEDDRSHNGNNSGSDVAKLGKSNDNDLEKPHKRKPKIELGNAIFVRKNLLCDSNDEDSKLELLWIRSGLFKDFAPIVPSCSGSRITGKARKRLLACDSDGFIAMKLRTKKSRTIEDHQPVELLLFCTHLFYDPNFPHVKAMQAEILGHLAHICVTGKLIQNEKNDKNAQNGKKKKRNKKFPSKNENEQSLEAVPSEENQSGIRSSDFIKPCAVVIAGDLNTVPLFQPEFLPTEEEFNNLQTAYSFRKTLPAEQSNSNNDKKQHNFLTVDSRENDFSLEGLPKSFQQSGAFRLITEGILEANHPEHPDTFGRGKENNNPKRKRCGPLFMPFFTTHESVNPSESKILEYYDPAVHHCGFNLAYPYDHDHFLSASTKEDQINVECNKNKNQQNCFPERTTRVSDFEGVLDYILWREYCGTAAIQADNNKKQAVSVDHQSPVIWQTGVLNVPHIPDPIPSKEHTSDHLPVGMSFDLLKSRYSRSVSCKCSNYT